MNEAIVYIAPTEPFVLSDEASRTYRKELAYEGEFSAHGKMFRIDEALLLHWHRTHAEFLKNGIEVPVPVEHTEDPEKRRGTLVGTELGMRKDGRRNIIGLIQFRDAEAEKLKASQVSVYVPPEFVDGKKNRYVRPIRHVALTDYPVIPGLGQFEPIAASLVGGTSSMALRDLANELGISADTADAELEAAITTKVKALVDENKKLKEAPKNDSGSGNPPQKKPDAVAASLVNVVRDNRSMKLDNLVREGKITPATRTKLEKQFCSEEALQLSFGETGDAFDATIDALKENASVLPKGEQTGAQLGSALSLSHPNMKAENNPLIADAERRAAEAKR